MTSLFRSLLCFHSLAAGSEVGRMEACGYLGRSYSGKVSGLQRCLILSMAESLGLRTWHLPFNSSIIIIIFFSFNLLEWLQFQKTLLCGTFNNYEECGDLNIFSYGRYINVYEQYCKKVYWKTIFSKLFFQCLGTSYGATEMLEIDTQDIWNILFYPKKRASS